MVTDLLARGDVPLDMPTLDFMIHHVFLPPRLPQEDDTNIQHSLTMVQVLRNSVSDFMAAQRDSSDSVQHGLGMLDRFLKTISKAGAGKTKVTNRDALRSVIVELKDGGK